VTVAYSDPLIGAVIADRYEVIRRIAKGGMGMIYEVTNIRLGRTFALKTITAEAAQDPEVLQRFRREAEIVANLRHPHIVEVVDWDQLDDGAPFLVMEYLQGETLATRIAAVGPLPWPQIARICDQVLSAITVAHRAGVVHRDLKPDNIFLASDDAGDERVKLLDFGISKIRDSTTFQTTDAKVLGTPAYMAPEQAEGQHDKIGPATDVWALGAIIYEMVTGEVAFAAPSTPAILYRVCHGRPTPANQLRPDAPTELVELLDWALDLQLRQDNVAEFRDEIRRVLGKLEGVTWAAPMRSRTMDAVSRHTPVPFPRAATPVGLLGMAEPGAVSMAAPRALTPRPGTAPVVDPTPVPAPIQVSAPLAPPRKRPWLLVAGAAGFIAAAVAAFLVIRSSPASSPGPTPDAQVIETVAPVIVPDAREAPIPPEPPIQETVAVEIDSTPRGADVFRLPSELKIGVTPWKGTLDRGDGTAVFIVKATGRHDAKVEIDLRTGGSAIARLRPAAPSRKVPVVKKQGVGRRKGEPVNPFDKKK